MGGNIASPVQSGVSCDCKYKPRRYLPANVGRDPQHLAVTIHFSTSSGIYHSKELSSDGRHIAWETDKGSHVNLLYK